MSDLHSYAQADCFLTPFLFPHNINVFLMSLCGFFSVNFSLLFMFRFPPDSGWGFFVVVCLPFFFFLALPIRVISLLIYSWPQQDYLTYGKYTSEEIIYIIEIN